MLHQNPEHRRARRPTWGMGSVGISMLELLRQSKRESLCTAAIGWTATAASSGAMAVPLAVSEQFEHTDPD